MNKENERILKQIEKQQERQEKISAIVYVTLSIIFVVGLILFYLIFGY